MSAGGTTSLISSILNPSFGGAPDAKALAKYLVNATLVIKRNDLPVRIYLTHDVTEKIGDILSAMGVRFKTVPVDRMEPPYIFLTLEDTYLIIKTVDINGKEVRTFRTPFSEFIEALKEYASHRMRKRKREEEEKRTVYIDDEMTKDLKKFMEWYGKTFGEW